MALVEDRHWWYSALRARVVADLEREGLQDGGRVLDMGCGTGGTWKALSRRWPALEYVGVDPADAALEAAKEAGVPRVVRGGLDEEPPAKELDAILSLDTLYYAKDERAALGRLAGALKPGGVLILNLPAFEAARGRHDDAVGVVRRYRRSEVANLLAGTGLELRVLEYWNAALFPAAFAWRVASRALPGEAESDLSVPPAWINRTLAAWLGAEGAIGRVLPPPFGLSVYAVAVLR